MKNILRIHCSPRGTASESYRLSQTIVAHLQVQHPRAQLVDRALAAHALPHVDSDYADVLGGHAKIGNESGSLSESEMLIQELESADCLVISTPMHNYTVPSALKAWVDHVVRVNRSFQPTPQGKLGTLRDRPVYVAISSGGTFGGGASRQPDFLTPYLTAVLNTIGLRSIAFFSVQGAAFGAEALAQARQAAQTQLAEHFAVLEAG